ncbi:MAG: YihA family ribosome biogenesis GTP-binding protein [Candidatus Dadabacteria bacterium]|nr:MAG: YihA family ribosome biogenesis GTP-binding protein [Candidatus Dadabacteria bacterium]
MAHRVFAGAQFTVSAPRLADCPAEGPPEIAFAGHSNAGKSSVLNRLTGRRQLARTSKTPGRTQALNFFETDAARLVDLPGYGYAKVPREMLARWGRHIDDYLSRRRTLVGIVLVSDVRHAPKPFDRAMLDWAEAAEMPLHLLLNKADKLRRGPASARLYAVSSEVNTYSSASVQLFSAADGTGLEVLEEVLAGWIETDAFGRKRRGPTG